MIIVGTDVKYAAASNTVNTAITPDLLDAGSIGIYTVDQTTGLFKLVVKSGSPPTGTVSSATVKTGFLKIVQGLGSGDFYVSEYHDVVGIRQILGSKYRAGSAQTVYVGYNPNTGVGDLNFLPTSSFTNTIGNFYDINAREAGIKLREHYKGNNSYGPDIFFNQVVSNTDTALAIANRLITDINAYQVDGILGTVFTSTLTGNILTAPVQTASTAALSGGTVPDATYYSKVVYINANGWSLASNEISVVAASTSANQSTLTFNWGVPPAGTTSSRVYVSTVSGAYTSYYNVASSSTHTLTITALGTPVVAAIPTSTVLGIAISAIDIYQLYEASVYDGFNQATVSYLQPVTPSGDPYQLAGLKGNWIKTEAESNIYRGDMYTMSTVEKKLPKTVDLTKTYDTYEIQTVNTTLDKTGQKATTDNLVKTLVAFVVQGNVLDTNQQANFEQIMTDIFAATPQISA